MKSLLLSTLLILSGTDLYPHSGGLDQRGGHYNRKTGDYHYHRKTSPNRPSLPSNIPPTSMQRIANLEKKIDVLVQRIKELEQRVKELEQITNESADEDSNIPIYTTRTGKKYHRANCPHLRNSRIFQPSLEQIKKTHQPCLTCKPPR
ncbi:MAG: YHYH domain-containing protein [Gemmatimonadota bacterium]|nr:YHYH domain-containing protein [Gemmatimonadota bacterium]